MGRIRKITALAMAAVFAACGPGAIGGGGENNGANNGTNDGGNNGATNGGVDLDPLDPPPAGAWAAFRVDAARTGYNPGATTGRTVAGEVWRVEDVNTTGYGAAKGSPSVWGDTLYIGTDDSRFLAIDRADGSILWEKTIEETNHGIHGSPSIGPERVYIGAYDGTVYAYDRETGEEAWSYDHGFQIGSSPILVPEHGRVYTAHEHSSSGGGWVTSVDARTGEEIWDYRIRAHAHSSVAVDLESEMIFVGDNLAIMHGWDIFSGEKLWEHQLDQTSDDQSDIKTTPTVISRHGIVVAGAWSKMVHAWDVETGEIVWEYPVGASVMGSTAYAPGRDVIYVGSLSPARSLHAIAAEDGSEVWATEIGSSTMSSPAISGDESLVVIGANDGFVYAFDAETGDAVWDHEAGGAVTSSPALVDDMVYVAAKNGDLVAIRTE